MPKLSGIEKGFARYGAKFTKCPLLAEIGRSLGFGLLRELQGIIHFYSQQLALGLLPRNAAAFYGATLRAFTVVIQRISRTASSSQPHVTACPSIAACVLPVQN